MPRDAFMKLSDQRKKVIIDTGIAAFSQRSYADVGTDDITKQCGISKGLLFHYFGSKKEYYFYCIEKAMEAIIAPLVIPDDCHLYDVFYSLLKSKMELCQKHPNEMRLSMMAARESCSEIKESKNTVLTHYLARARVDTAEIMALAAQKISFKPGVDEGKATAALQIFVQSLINRYVEKYQDRPDAFLKNYESIKKEFCQYIEFVLLGIAQ